MNILLIRPVPKLWEGYSGYCQGIGSISAVLKKAGHRTRLLEPYRYEPGMLDRNLSDFNPGIAAISATSNQMGLVRSIIEHIRKRGGVPVVLGGAHPTVAPHETARLEGVFGVCVGEGEYPMLELANALEKREDHSKIKNFWFNKNGAVVKNDVRPLISDLDALPFPDREIYDYRKMLDAAELGAEFMGSRGCPMRCAYCINHSLRKLFKDKGRYVRYRSVDNLLEEIESVKTKYNNVNFVGFHDDTFTLNREWLQEFCDKYAKHFKIPYWCNVRVDTVDKHVAGILKKSGCSCVHVGVESGDDYIRETVLKKDTTRAQIAECFKLCRAAGIETSAFNMIGLPYETPAAIEETIELNRAVKPDYAFVSVFYPYPGTELRTLCEEKGWLSKREVESYFDPSSVLDQPSISREQVLYYYKIFQPLINYPKLDKIIKLLGRIKVWKGVTVMDAFRILNRKLKER